MLFQALENLKNHSGFVRYSKNTLWLFFDKVAKSVFYLITWILIARLLGPDQFGVLNYAISFVFFFTSIAGLGLDDIVVRALLKKEYLTETILGTALVIKILGSILSLFLIFLVTFLVGDDYSTKKIIYIISISIFFHSFNVFIFYFQSQVLLKFPALSNIFTLIISTVIKLYLIMNDADLFYFALMFILDGFFLSIFLIYFFTKSSVIPLSKLNFDKPLALNLIRDSWPLIFTGLLISIYMKIDQIMVTQILGSSENGIYSAAVFLSESFNFIALVITVSVFPAILNAKNKNNNLYEKRISNLYFVLFWLSIFISICITLTGSFLVDILYGEEFLESAYILKIHIWSSIFVFLGLANSKWFVSENLQKFSMIYTFIGAFLNIVLNYFWLQNIGISGAAWATLVSYFFAAYICLLIFKDTRGSFLRINKSIFRFRI